VITTWTLDGRALANVLARLPVHVEELCCRSGCVGVSDYPGGRRPTTLVAISGRGCTGFGENVAFSVAEQRAFADGAAGLIVAASGTVGSLLAARADGYGRAALEAALIDLAMRQAGLSFRELCGVAEAALRWVASMGPLAAPAEQLRIMRAAGRATEFKLDVAPAWSEAVVGELRQEPGVVILDFKEGASPALCDRLRRAFPGVVFEDPPASFRDVTGPVARDRPVLAVEDVEAAVRAGEAVNLKAPRMGGVLRVLEALSAVRRQGGRAYFGGMFEIGPGRQQARQLAALFCGDDPNDLGPVCEAAAELGRSPCPVRLDVPGFGAGRDWAALPL
jgi:L-alanine-DL-glutamate epimerase-like enolase superfamily enzyme